MADLPADAVDAAGTVHAATAAAAGKWHAEPVLQALSRTAQPTSLASQRMSNERNPNRPLGSDTRFAEQD